MTHVEADPQAMMRALIVHPDDNVANLIGPGKQGHQVSCVVEGQDGIETIELVDDLPSNHKLARRDIQAGEPIIKYGLTIGKASQAIGRGQHVHIHNIESGRGRGDLNRE
ncbi:MAG: D-galactarate dehydratase [Luteitalea sp.]|nr:D-galactarate dehydratase [Luteitalea sp.]